MRRLHHDGASLCEPLEPRVLLSGEGLRAEYYDNANFTNIRLKRTDPTIDFDWRSSAPTVNIGADTFSVRWVGYVQPQYDALYTFYARTDDGVRLWVDGRLVIDHWSDQDATESVGSIALDSGRYYSIRMEYYDNTGSATARLSWSCAAQTKQIIPQMRLSVSAPARAGLRGEYFDNANFTGSRVVRNDSSVNFNWGEGAPLGTMGVDAFSVRWTGFVQPSAGGTYTFYTTSDDGVRLWVDDRPLIEHWSDQAATEYSGTIKLVGGRLYKIRMDYYDNAEAAVARLSWSGPGFSKQVIPPGSLLQPILATTGLLGEYFDDTKLADRHLVRTDATVDYTWGEDSPDPAVGSETFSARWRGYIVPPVTQTYTFYTSTDDGARLWVDGQLLIDQWHDQTATEHKRTIDLVAGVYYEIKLDYYDNAESAQARLSWSGPFLLKQVVPQSSLMVRLARTRNDVSLGPLRLQSASGFVPDPGSERRVAQGDVLIGLSSSSPFKPLIKASGTVWYDTRNICVDGTVTSLIGNVAKPLVDGVLLFPMGRTATSQVSRRPADVLGLAGLGLVPTALKLSSTGGGRIELSGKLKMPSALGSLVLDVPAATPLIVAASGLSLGALMLPNTTFSLGGAIEVRPQIRVDYQSGSDTLRLTGIVVASKLFNWTSEVPIGITQKNFVEIRGGQVTGGAIHLVAPLIPIVPGFLEIQNAQFDLNTIDHTIGGSGTLACPSGIKISATVGFRDGKLDRIGGGMENAALGPTVFRGGSFEVQNLTDQSKLTVKIQDVTLAAPGGISVKLPDKLGGTHSGSILEMTGSGTFDRTRMSLTGTSKHLGGLFNHTTTLTYPWASGEFGIGTTNSLLFGLFQITRKVVIGSNLDFKTGVSVGSSLPDWLRVALAALVIPLNPTGLKVEVDSIGYAMNFSNDNNTANDYFAVWQKISLKGWITGITYYSIAVGKQWYFDGNARNLINSDVDPLINWVNSNFA